MLLYEVCQVNGLRYRGRERDPGDNSFLGKAEFELDSVIREFEMTCPRPLMPSGGIFRRLRMAPWLTKVYHFFEFIVIILIIAISWSL